MVKIGWLEATCLLIGTGLGAWALTLAYPSVPLPITIPPGGGHKIVLSQNWVGRLYTNAKPVDCAWGSVPQVLLVGTFKQEKKLVALNVEHISNGFRYSTARANLYLPNTLTDAQLIAGPDLLYLEINGHQFEIGACPSTLDP